MRLPVIVCAVAFAAVSSIGCKDSPSSPSNGAGVPYSQTDLRLGTGAEATSGKRLTVNYSGWLYSATGAENKGALFDTSANRGSFTFTLGAGQVIAGWEQGCVGMKMGGLRRLVIPPELGYGSTATGSIPANSTLVFDIELINVQ